MSAQPKEVKKNEENTYYSTNRPQTESVRKSKVNLNDFEGPLDLLLFFIKRDKLNIYDIPISKITNDFLDYISK